MPLRNYSLTHPLVRKQRDIELSLEGGALWNVTGKCVLGDLKLYYCWCADVVSKLCWPCIVGFDLGVEEWIEWQFWVSDTGTVNDGARIRRLWAEISDEGQSRSLDYCPSVSPCENSLLMSDTIFVSAFLAFFLIHFTLLFSPRTASPLWHLYDCGELLCSNFNAIYSYRSRRRDIRQACAEAIVQ